MLDKTIFMEYDRGGNITKKEEYKYSLKTKEEIKEKIEKQRALQEKMLASGEITKEEKFVVEPIIYEFTYKSNGWKDQLVKHKDNEYGTENVVNYEYDELGNILKIPYDLTWSNGRLASYSLYSYRYNERGFLESKYNSLFGTTTNYYYNDKDQLIAETDLLNGNYYYHYGVDGPVGFAIGNEYYTYKKNIQGDITGLYDSTGTLIAKYVYDAWGNHEIYYLKDNKYLKKGSESNSNLYVAERNPYRYRGYYYDSIIRKYNLKSRYYDPKLGRFISPDDLSYLDKDSINGLNLYAYCGNNPVNNVDPDGHAWWNWFVAGIAIVVSIVISIASFGTATPVIVGAAIGTIVGGGFEIGRQLATSGTVSDWNSVLYSALGGLVSGAIAGIPIGGSGLLSYLGTFLAGGIGSAVGGIVSGSVTNLKTAFTAFAIGGVSNVIARGISDVISFVKSNKIFNQSSKAKSLSIQQLQGSKFNMGSTALKGSLRNSFKDYSIAQIFALVKNAEFVFRNGVYSGIVSSLMGGWY